jgi:WD40 repeat protein
MSSATPGTVEGQLRRARGELEAGLRAGTGVRAEELLLAYPAVAADPEAAIELVYTEFVVRGELGQSPRPDEWYERFPQWRADLEQMFQVHDALCRSAAGRPAPPPADRGPFRLPGYEVLGEIGRGGMGVVYKARHLKLNRLVAVKVILAGDRAGPKERERFCREAEAAARLDHPNIVRVFEVGEHDGHPYCAMEYVAGGPLADRMTGTPWPPAVAARLIAELARAADHAHRRGVVHRDLKPANILVTRGDAAAAADHPTREFRPSQPLIDLEADEAGRAVPKIVDFGLAKSLTDSHPTLTRAGDVVGTPLYMAPEQADGRAADVGPATDVWALGVVLYELLTGHPPFAGDSAAETLHQVRTADPVPPRQLRPKLPRDLDTVCLRCLQKDPRRRYAGAAAVADDLERWGRGEPIAARPVGWLETAGGWARREPLAAGLVVGLIAVLAAGAGGVVWQWQRAEWRRAEADSARGDAVQLSRLEAEAREAAEARLYASQIARAAADIAASRTAAAERLLDDCLARQPDRCRWEWEYLKRKCRTHLVEMAGHTQPVVSVLFTPDGRRLVSGAGVWNGTGPGEAKVWDAATGAFLYDLPGLTRPVYRLALHPAGTQAAAACGGGLVRRWDLADPPRPLPPLDCGALAYSVAYHPDGRTLAVACADGSVQIWDASTGTRRWRFPWHTHNVYDVAYSPDGRYLATCCRDAAATVRSADDYRVLFELRTVSDARRVAFCGDGRLAATTSFDGEVVLWDLAAGGRRAAARHVGAGNGRAIAFRPDGRFLACAARDADLRVWYVRGQEDAPPAGPGTGSALAVGYSPDAARLAVAREDHVIRVWDQTAPPDGRSVPWPEAWVAALAVSPDGRTVALAGTRNVTHGGGSKAVRLLPDGGGPSVDLPGHAGWPTAVAYRPDGRQLASADESGGVILWDPAARAAVGRLAGHAGAVNAVAYRPDGERLVTAGADGTARVWDAGGRECGRLDHPAGVLAAAYSPDGRLLATGGTDRLVRVWDADTLALRHALPGHRAAVAAVAFRPGTAELATADEESEVRFWDAAAGRDRTAHTQPPVTAPVPTADDRPGRPAVRTGGTLAFSPDGRRLLTGGPARPVQVWDADARRPLLDLAEPDFQHRHLVAAHPDGRRLLTATRGTVRFWDATVEPADARRAAAAARLTDWHADRADADKAIGTWHGVDFHLTRLLAADPARPDRLARRAEARSALGRPAEAAADFAAAFALVAPGLGRPPLLPGDFRVWLSRGEAAARAGRWAEAVACNRLALAHRPTAIDAPVNLATAHLAAGDEAAYRAACRALVRPAAAARPAVTAVVFRSLLPLRAGLTADEWVRLGTRARAAGGHTLLAAAYYRAGRPADAVRAFGAGFSIPRAGDMCVRAMAHHRAGQPAEAARWLDRARAWAAEADRLDADPAAWGQARWEHWNERVWAAALRREAEELIGRPADSR